MGKGFNNFMSKKDFHPSAIWNLKKVWEARQKEDMKKKREEEMRSQYDKEQEILNNKALLGDEKAKMGLSFMYDPPVGVNKEKKVEIEPKFEWQRKFNAPREEWAKNQEGIHDQPFGIAVRNVRCVKCHVWGHLNTDNECPLYNMSGNYEDAGYSNNPSDLIRELSKRRASEASRPERKEQKGAASDREAPVIDGPASSSSSVAVGNAPDLQDEIIRKRKHEKIATNTLVEGMEEEYGLTLKRSMVDQIRADDALELMGKKRVEKVNTVDKKLTEQELMIQFLQSISEKERAKILNKFFKSESSSKEKKKHKKHKKDKRHRSREDKERRHVKDEPRSLSPPANEGKHRSQKQSERRIKEELRSPSTARLSKGVDSVRRRHDSSSDEKNDRKYSAYIRNHK